MLDYLQQLGDWLIAHERTAIPALVSLFLSAVTISAAEGGRSRRRLARVKQELEVLKLLAEHNHERHFATYEEALIRQVHKRLDAYVMTRTERTTQRVGELLSFLIVAGLLLAVYDYVRVELFGQDRLFPDIISGIGSFVFVILSLSLLGLAWEGVSYLWERFVLGALYRLLPFPPTEAEIEAEEAHDAAQAAEAAAEAATAATHRTHDGHRYVEDDEITHVL